MHMICRVTDEKFSETNTWDGENKDVTPAAGLNGISLYDIMSEDVSLWVGRNKQFGYIVEIENEEGQVFEDRNLHPCAVDSMAEFCRKFLNMYDKIAK